VQPTTATQTQVEVALLVLAFVIFLQAQELYTQSQLVEEQEPLEQAAQPPLLMLELLELLQMVVMEEAKTVTLAVAVDLQVLT
jgi:hypothetical protein